MSESLKQLNLISKKSAFLYQQKWKNIALTKISTRECRQQTINSIYHSLGFSTPEILYFNSPHAALRMLSIQEKEELGRGIKTEIAQALARLQSSLEQQFEPELFTQIRNEWKLDAIEQIENMGWAELQTRLKKEIDEPQWEKLNSQLWILQQLKTDKTESQAEYILNGFYGNRWTSLACLTDFCINILNCQYDVIWWEILQNLVTTCGWIFPFEKVCFVCDRPVKIILNSEAQLHNLKNTAMEYADGYGIYAHHGVILPEKYGRVHPAQWQPQWLLSETNSQLQQILIQTIGYNRLYRELETIELDGDRECVLCKIALDSDIEPIHLLKINLGDNEINCLSVPSNIRSAKEALSWINWDDV
jgi:hypothetical protein